MERKELRNHFCCSRYYSREFFFNFGVSENDNSLWFVIKGLINQQLPFA